jgi:glutaminase
VETTSAETHAASPVQTLLEDLHRRHLSDRSGEVASYIPELSTADPVWFGICLVTADGAVYEVGDTRRQFTIQSISKPLTYALALEAIGEAAVRRHVDVEPSGEAFNSITLKPSGIPPNPMVNAGAIATASLISPLGFDRPIDRILNEYSAFAGRDLAIDEAVFASENRTGYRNRAIAWLMKNSGALGEQADVDEVVDTYFRQCSTLVDCRDLATVAATLASTGVNPVTHERVLREETVRNVLSVMASCGMYDAAGDWLYSVGLPAKSGVAGGIIAVLPGQLGIAVYSPPLDEHGNSVRGVRVCEELSEELHLHVMSPARRPAPPIRALRTCVESRSRKLRPEAEQSVLRQHGGKVREVELQGEINFAAGELIARTVLAGTPAAADAGAGSGSGETVEFAILDFDSVRGVDPALVPILSGLVDAFEATGGRIALSSIRHHPDLIARLNSFREQAGATPLRTIADLDLAVEWAEDCLLRKYGDFADPGEMPLEEHGATRDMSAAQVETLAAVLERREFESGETIYAEDDEVDDLLLVTAGTVNVVVRDREGDPRRISTLPAGLTLGEIAMLSGGRRLGWSIASGEVVAWSLSASSYRRLRETEPAMLSILLENMMKMIALRVSNLRRELTD